jgi:NhaP-type Na+/H+ or K+/H+ antiporter
MRSGCVFRLEVILVILAVSYASSVSDHDDADHRNGTGHEEAAHHDDHHPTHHYVIYFMTLAIALGVGTQQILDRYIPTLPYTAVLLVEGLVIGMLVEYAGSAGFPKLVQSIEMWEAIDPHLMLYIFLPALLFGDAMHLNVHLFYRTFWQCMLLASPGVMLGTGLTALCAKFILPYNWSWSLSLAFGSILAATDPVAVVALLNAVGASPILTMQITGESLLNDGTAIVVFNIFFSVVDSGRSYTPGELIAYFTQLALGGPALGLCFGLFFLWWMRKLSRTTSHQDSVLQISLTVCCAYGSFFAAEELFEVSGVLCTVTAALVLAEYVSGLSKRISVDSNCCYPNAFLYYFASPPPPSPRSVHPFSPPGPPSDCQ